MASTQDIVLHAETMLTQKSVQLKPRSECRCGSEHEGEQDEAKGKITKSWTPYADLISGNNIYFTLLILWKYVAALRKQLDVEIYMVTNKAGDDDLIGQQVCRQLKQNCSKFSNHTYVWVTCTIAPTNSIPNVSEEYSVIVKLNFHASFHGDKSPNKKPRQEESKNPAYLRHYVDKHIEKDARTGYVVIYDKNSLELIAISPPFCWISNAGNRTTEAAGKVEGRPTRRTTTRRSKGKAGDNPLPNLMSYSDGCESRHDATISSNLITQHANSLEPHRLTTTQVFEAPQDPFPQVQPKTHFSAPNSVFELPQTVDFPQDQDQFRQSLVLAKFVLERVREAQLLCIADQASFSMLQFLQTLLPQEQIFQAQLCLTHILQAQSPQIYLQAQSPQVHVLQVQAHQVQSNQVQSHQVQSALQPQSALQQQILQGRNFILTQQFEAEFNQAQQYLPEQLETQSTDVWMDKTSTEDLALSSTPPSSPSYLPVEAFLNKNYQG